MLVLMPMGLAEVGRGLSRRDRHLARRTSEFRGQPNLSLPQALQLGTTGTIEGGR